MRFYIFRHPILCKVYERTRSRDSFDVKIRNKEVSGSQIPWFIPNDQRGVLSNSELLQTNFIDCFGSDSDVRLFDPKNFGEIDADSK